MARAGTRKRKPVELGDAPRRIVDAALETLKEEGYVGASTRVIAERGGFSQGLIFYHFGSVRELLLAALDKTSAQRMDAYREATAEVRSIAELVEVAGRIYRQDLDEGHVKVLVEMITASSVEPELADEVIDRIQPWISLTEETLRGALAGTSLDGMVPIHSAAYAIIALYLGVEVLTHLSGDRSEAEALFTAAAGTSALLAPLLAEQSSPES